MIEKYGIDVSEAINPINKLATSFKDLGIATNKTLREIEAYGPKGQVVLKFTEEVIAGNKKIIQIQEQVGASTRQLGVVVVDNNSKMLASTRNMVTDVVNLLRQEVKGWNFLSDESRRSMISQRLEIEKTKAAMESMALAQQKMQSMMGNVGGKGGQFSSTLGYYQPGPQKQIPANSNQGIGDNYKALADSATKSAVAVEKANQRIALSYQSVLRIIQAQILFRIIAESVAKLEEGVRTATTFSVRIAEIQTISQKAGVSNTQLSKEIQALSSEFASPVLQVAEGYYQAISNQVVTAANATAFMREEQKLAITTMSTLDQAVNTTTSLLNAYGLSALEAGRVNAVLFRGVDIGRFRLEDLSNSLGRTSVFANQLNITIEEQVAMLTLLTRMGIEPQRALTYLANVMTHLAKPSQELVKVFKEWGVASGTAAIQTFGIVGVFERLNQIVEKSGDSLGEISKLFSDMRASAGAASLIGNFDQYKADLDSMTTIAREEYEKATTIILESTGQRIKKEVNNLNLYFMALGESVGKNFLAIGEALGGWTKVLQVMIHEVSIGLTVWAGYKIIPPILEAITKQMAAANAVTMTSAQAYMSGYQNINKTVSAYKVLTGVLGGVVRAYGPLLAIWAGMEAVTYVMRSAERAEEEFQETLKRRVKIEEEAYKDTLQRRQDYVESYKKTLDKQLQYVYVYASLLAKANNQIIDANAKALDENLRVLKLAQTDALKDIAKNITELERRIEKSKSNSERLQAELERRQLKTQEGTFEATLVGKSPLQQLQLLMAERAKLMAQGNTLLQQGDAKVGLDYIARADVVWTRITTIRKQAAEEAQRFEEKKNEEVLDDERKTQNERERLQLRSNQRLQAAQTRESERGWRNRRGGQRWGGQSIDRAVQDNQFANQRGVLQDRQRNAERLAAEEAINRKVQETQRILLLGRQAELAFKKEEEATQNRIHAAAAIEREKARREAEALAAAKVKQNAIIEKFSEIDRFKLSKDSKASDFKTLVDQTEQLMRQSGIKDVEFQRALQRQRIRERELALQEKLTAYEQRRLDINNKLTEATKAHKEAIDAETNLPEKIKEEVTKRIPELQDAWKEVGENHDITNDYGIAGANRIIDREKIDARFRKGNAYLLEDQQARESIGLFRRRMLSAQAEYNANPTIDALNRFRTSAQALQGRDRQIQEQTGRSWLSEVGVKQLEKIIKVTGDQLERFNAAKKQSVDTQKAIDFLNATIRNLNPTLRGQIEKEIKERDKSAASLNDFTSQVRDTISQLNGLAREIQVARAELNRVNVPGQPAGFARGGFVGQGTDVIPAMLSRGEYIWDARTTRMYYPIISALHQANKASSVTNVGDINVSVQGGDSSSATIQSIAQGLRRGIRRGTIRLS